MSTRTISSGCWGAGASAPSKKHPPDHPGERKTRESPLLVRTPAWEMGDQVASDKSRRLKTPKSENRWAMRAISSSNTVFHRVGHAWWSGWRPVIPCCCRSTCSRATRSMPAKLPRVTATGCSTAASSFSSPTTSCSSWGWRAGAISSTAPTSAPFSSWTWPIPVTATSGSGPAGPRCSTGPTRCWSSPSGSPGWSLRCVSSSSTAPFRDCTGRYCCCACCSPSWVCWPLHCRRGVWRWSSLSCRCCCCRCWCPCWAGSPSSPGTARPSIFCSVPWRTLPGARSRRSRYGVSFPIRPTC